jgi:hypothetical protein
MRKSLKMKVIGVIDIFEKSQITETSKIEVLLLYFDSLFGYVPFIIYPYDSIRLDHERTRMIGTLALYFDEQEKNSLLVLELGKKVYFAEKFDVFSEKSSQFECCAICLILPVELHIIGEKLLELLKNYIMKRFKHSLYLIVESEISKYEIVQNERKKQIIIKGDILKKRVLELINFICSIFLNSISGFPDMNSVKLQKAISFLESIGADISHLERLSKNNFSNINIFESIPKICEYEHKFDIINVKFNEISEEIEIIIKNMAHKIFEQLNIRISQIHDLFEKELMNVVVDTWLLDEEILFAFPSYIVDTHFLITIRDRVEDNIVFSKEVPLEELLILK